MLFFFINLYSARKLENDLGYTVKAVVDNGGRVNCIRFFSLTFR